MQRHHDLIMAHAVRQTTFFRQRAAMQLICEAIDNSDYVDSALTRVVVQNITQVIILKVQSELTIRTMISSAFLVARSRKTCKFAFSSFWCRSLSIMYASCTSVTLLTSISNVISPMFTAWNSCCSRIKPRKEHNRTIEKYEN